MAKKKKKELSHFGWPDAVVIFGAALMLAASIYEGNWFFLSLGVAIVAAIVVRVLVTQWLVKQHLNKK